MAASKKLKKQILASDNADLADGVGAAIFPDDNGYPFHAAIFVVKGEEKSVFHFDAVNLLESKLGECRGFLFKEFSSILPKEAGAFLVCCREAINNSAPGYNYYYNGGYFTRDGQFVGIDGEPSYHMTCVGFCLGVLKGWFEGEDYIAYEDWQASNTLSADKIAEELAKLKYIYGGFSDEELAENIRRIKPIEYLASAFFNNHPIHKSETDKISGKIAVIFNQWYESVTNPSSPIVS